MDTGKTNKILIVFYSLGGNIVKVAKSIAEGAREIEGTTVDIKRVRELIPDDVFENNPRMKAEREQIEQEFAEATIDDLINADGIVFGTPVHFGSFASQIKQFIDQLSPVWLEGKLVSKPVSVFCTSHSLHGGEEVALFSLLAPLMNLGMIPIGIPYPVQGASPRFDGGSPFGVIFTTGKNEDRREFSEDDHEVAKVLGHRLSAMAKVLSCSCGTCTDHHALTKKTY